jgi:DNA-binding HxlR family transcriptional regulator
MSITDPPPRRSCCPIACTLDLLGDRWTLLVIRDLFAGKSKFSEFQRSPEGIATNILTDRLNLLVQNDLAERYTPPNAKRDRYRLTQKGRSLDRVLLAVTDWGLRSLPGTEARILPAPSATP